MSENNIDSEMIESDGIEATNPMVVNPDDISRIIKEIPSEPDRKVMEAVVMSTRYSGPLPPPEFLSAYKDILPGSPERILVMAEKEQQHRHDVDDTVVKSTMLQRLLGQILGSLLAFFFGGASLVLGLYGHEWLAGILGTSTVIGLATIFVLNRKPGKGSKGTDIPKDDVEEL